MQTTLIKNNFESAQLNNQCCQYSLMAYSINTKGSSNLMPPIELARFQAKEPMEDTIIRWMHRIISNKQQFSVQLVQHIDAVTGKLRIGIVDTTPFIQLAAQLSVVNQYIGSYDCPEMQLNIRPQMHIPQSEFVFDGVFHINEFVLLKKEHAFDAYKQLNVFGLRP